MADLGLASKKFAEKVKNMNQSNSSQMVLTAREARDLLSDIFDLLATIAASKTQNSDELTVVNASGGKF